MSGSDKDYVIKPSTTPVTTSAPAPKVEISEEEKKLAEEKCAAEIERNRKNAEENKKKMEALYGKQRDTEQAQPQAESLSVKQKMDMLIPIAVKCNWKEADVREAVRLMENCGVRFNMLSTKEPSYDVGKNQFTFSIQDSMYDSQPFLRVRVSENHISRISLEITSNTAVSYFREKSQQRVDPFKHTYSSDILLYAKDDERELVNKNNFDKIIFSRAELDKMKAQVNSYIKSKGGTGFDNFSLKVAVQFETDTYNNPVKIPIDDFVNGKVLFLCQVDFSTKSEVYGKDKDHYHAEILINGDNVQEISLKGDNIKQTPSNKIWYNKNFKKSFVNEFMETSHARRRSSFDEIILPQSVKDKILDVANYAENSKKVFEEWGLQKVYKQSRRIGINLYGEPGTGKTMAAATNSILFFDEADAILSKCVTNMSGATDVSVNQTRSVMLMLMNEYQDFIIFATNFISNFDPAFMRRISTHIEFKLPDLDCRKKLRNYYILSTMPNNMDVEELAEKYNGISGSDISNAVLMAAFKAARQNAKLADKSPVFEAVEETLASKNANKGVTVEKRVVSEEYVKERIPKVKEQSRRPSSDNGEVYL